MLACVNAIGNGLPPMAIFDRQTFPIELATGEIPGTIYGFSHSGWIDQDLFDKWFNKHFLRYAPAFITHGWPFFPLPPWDHT